MDQPNEFVLKLDSGLYIRLTNLSQWETYGGHLAGRPSSEGNQKLITGAQRYAHDVLQFQPSPTLIGFKNLHKPPPLLPFKAVCAAFECDYMPLASHADFTRLSLLWFQDEWAMPINPLILNEIQRIDWHKNAHACLL
jgi:hypothetical protein